MTKKSKLASKNRFTHVTEVWLHDDSEFILEALEVAGISNYKAMIALLKRDSGSLNEIRALKNRSGELIGDERASKLLATYSYINELQNEYGTLGEGWVDITERDEDDFELFFEGNHEVVHYDIDAARAGKAARLAAERERVLFHARLQQQQSSVQSSQSSNTTSGSSSGTSPAVTASTGLSSAATATATSSVNQSTASAQSSTTGSSSGSNQNTAQASSNTANTGSSQAGSSSNTGGSSSTRKLTMLEQVQRQVRFDASAIRYPELKENKGSFRSFSIGFFTMARSEGLANTLKSKIEYTPSPGDETLAFELQRYHMIGVLWSKVLTDAGRAIVKNYLDSADTQDCWAELKAHHTKVGAVAAEARIEKLKKAIETPIPDTYIGELGKKLRQWMELCTELEELEDKNIGIDELRKERLTRMQRFLSLIPDMQSLGINMDLLKSFPSTSASASVTSDLVIQLYVKHADSMDLLKKRKVLSRRQQTVHEVSFANAEFQQLSVNVSEMLYDWRLSDDSWYSVCTASQVPSATNEVPQSTKKFARELAPEDLLGRSVLGKADELGQRRRAEIVGLVEDFEGQRNSNPELVKFRCKVGRSKVEEIMDYSDMCELIDEQMRDENGDRTFTRIVGHSTPTRKSETPKILVEWTNGEITLEPTFTWARSGSATANKYILAEYASKNGLVEEWDKIWPSLKIRKHAKNTKNLVRTMNQAKLVSYKNDPVYMFGYRVPRNHEQAMEIDRENGNTKWRDSEELEKKQLFDYETFIDKGPRATARIPAGYKKISYHFVYAVKHDGRHKSRCVAGGHLTDAPVESVYSGVVSLRGIRFTIFLAELNDLEVWQTDVGNAYLEAYTEEKVYVIAGPEFGNLKGNVLIIRKALYGLRSSSLRWYERFADVLRDMGFRPCPAEPEIWMRACNSDGSVMEVAEEMPIPLREKKSFFDPPERADDGSYYEYIAVYCDDLTIASKDPQGIAKILMEKYKFKLKGTEPLKYLLGCDYYREGKTLCAAPKKYIERMVSTYEQLFGEKPSAKYHSPLEKGDHPELDDSDFCDEEKTKIYQSMVGAAQWVISLGRFDIACHVMTLSSFRCKPRQGHLERMKRVYGYLSRMKHGAIRFRTEMPDISDFDYFEYNWSNSPYSGAREEFPKNLPTARGKPVLMTTFVDANLGHDVLSGKSVSGVLHFFNKTPIDWFSKKQATVETATFGSENNAARKAVEQIKDNKYTLMSLGVPIVDTPILLGDNKSVVDSNAQPHGKLHKRHLMLSYHYVRENIAAGIIRFAFVRGETNPADVLSKHWGYQNVWPFMRPILFWKGDTMDIEQYDKEAGGETLRIVGECQISQDAILVRILM